LLCPRNHFRELRVLRHVAFKLLKHYPAKLSLKRFRAAPDDLFLLELVSQA
jgi:hypothetical protein